MSIEFKLGVVFLIGCVVGVVVRAYKARKNR